MHDVLLNRDSLFPNIGIQGRSTRRFNRTSIENFKLTFRDESFPANRIGFSTNWNDIFPNLQQDKILEQSLKSSHGVSIHTLSRTHCIDPEAGKPFSAVPGTAPFLRSAADTPVLCNKLWVAAEEAARNAS